MAGPLPAVGEPQIFWPVDLQRRYAVSLATRWRWERTGRLPKRDFFLQGEPVGWKRSTIEAWEQNKGPADP